MIVRELLTKIGFTTDKKGMDKFDKQIQSIKKSLKLTAVGVIGLGIAFLKMAGEIEQTEIAFETMTGDVETAQKLMEDLTKFAATTPFELTGLIENSKKLLAFGFVADEIVDKMTVLGNIAAGVGRNKLPSIVLAFGKIRTKGKATMEELNILLEAGVPILDELAKNMAIASGQFTMEQLTGNTKVVNDRMAKLTQQLVKMVSKGKVGFKDVDAALASLATGTGKFANLMVKQSKSFLGLISNMKDFIAVFAIGVGKELLPQAKEFAKILIEWLQANRELIKQNVVGFFKGIFSVIKFLGKVFGTLIKFTSGFDKLVKLLFIIGIAFKVATLAAALFNITVLWIPILIAAIIAIVALLAEDIYQFFTGGESLIGDFFKMHVRVFKMIKKFVVGVWDKISSAIRARVSQIASFFTSLPGKFFDLLKTMGNAILNFFISVKDSIKAQIDSMITGITNIINKAKKLFGITGGAKIQENLSGIAPGTTRRPGAINNNSKSIKVNSNITLGVPPGTTDTQKKAIQDFAENSFSREFNKQLNILDMNNPVTE